MKYQGEINGNPVTVEFSIEGDPDGAIVIIEKITDELGNEIEDNPEYDFKFECKEYYANLQFETYMKTGQII